MILVNIQRFYYEQLPPEYASTVWNPYTKTEINKIEAVQIQIQIFLFPIKEPFRAEQLTKNVIQ